MSRFGSLLVVAGLVAVLLPSASAQELAPIPAEKLATTQPAGEAGVARIAVEPEAFDFGDVWCSASAKREFKIRNTGTAPLTLRAKSSCGCTVASKPESPLAPGMSTTFTIAYRTTTPGKANKTVTLHTNDPDRPVVRIAVRGEVKWLYEPTPHRRITFRNLDVDSEQSQKVVLENQADQPVHLKVDEVFGDQTIDVDLKELEAGQKYELTIKTKPPMKEGFNSSRVLLATDLPEVKQVEIPVTAHVPPRLAVVPKRIHVRRADRPTNQLLSVTYRANQPVKITNVTVEPETVRHERLPSIAPRAGMKTASHRLRLVVPPWEDLPPTGGRVIIETDDPNPQFARIEVPIVRAGITRTRGRVLPEDSLPPNAARPLGRPQHQRPAVLRPGAPIPNRTQKSGTEELKEAELQPAERVGGEEPTPNTTNKEAQQPKSTDKAKSAGELKPAEQVTPASELKPAEKVKSADEPEPAEKVESAERAGA